VEQKIRSLGHGTLGVLMSYATVPHIVRPKAVVRHLEVAGAERMAACMTSNYLRVPGTFGLSEESGNLIFLGRQSKVSRVARIECGQSVRVDYRFEEDNLVFFSRITESREPGSWQLTPPQTVQRLSRRSEVRHPISESSGVRLAMMSNHGFQSFPVVDLSSGGAAVRYDAREVGLWVGRRVTVWLETGDVKGVPVTIEVRHVSRRGCPPGQKIAGVRFVDPGADARRAIGQTLFGG
jgi:hypothetical protein